MWISSNPNHSKILHLQPEHLIQSLQGPMEQLLQSPQEGMPWCKSLVSMSRGRWHLGVLSPPMEGPGLVKDNC